MHAKLAVAPVSKMTTLSSLAEKMGQSTFNEVVDECPTDFCSDGVSSNVMVENEERGREGGATDGAGPVFPVALDIWVEGDTHCHADNNDSVPRFVD